MSSKSGKSDSRAGVRCVAGGYSSPRRAQVLQSSVTALALATLLACSAFAETSAKVEWTGGRLSVTAVKVPLSQIIREVSRQSGMEVRGSQELREQVSVHFSRLSLQQGLQNLLADVDYAILGDASTPERARKAQLVIFGHLSGASNGGAPPQVPVKPVTVTAPPSNQGRQSGAEDDQTLFKKIMSPDPTIQSQAFEDLAARNPEKAVEALQGAIKTDQPAVRLQALQLLDEFDQADPEAVFGALKGAIGDQDPKMKDYAIQALARRGGADAVSLLRQAFGDPDPSIRLMVIESLAQSGEGADLLHQALSDPDESVSSAAVQMLKDNSSENSDNSAPSQQGEEPEDQPPPNN